VFDYFSCTLDTQMQLLNEIKIADLHAFINLVDIAATAGHSVVVFPQR